MIAPVGKPAFVHETAVVDEGATLGVETKIWHFVHVSSGAVIGERCILGQNVFIGPGVTIGHGTKIQNNVSVYKGVTIEEEVFLGPSCVFTNVNNPRAFLERKDEFRQTIVGRGASIGANATIVCGHNVGRYAFIGAGSVVTKDVPDYALVVGNPARQIGWMCFCGNRLPDDAHPHCKTCDSKYELQGGKLRSLEDSTKT